MGIQLLKLTYLGDKSRMETHISYTHTWHYACNLTSFEDFNILSDLFYLCYVKHGILAKMALQWPYDT